MAKKVTEPAYVDAALIISKEKFQSLLETQIAKGEQLLSVNVPVQNQSMGGLNGYYGITRSRDKVDYDEEAEKQFIADFKRWHDYNNEIYKSSFDSTNSTYRHGYEVQVWAHWGGDIIKEYKDDIERLINQMKSDIEKLPLIKCKMSDHAKSAESHNMELSNRIFIVHGHDEALKEKVARTISQLDLKPIILHEQEDGGKTIIEKFESNAKYCQYAVVLLTADDLGQSKKDKAKGDEPKERARQNVVFEMGYFMGKLTRSRVFVLLDDGVDKPGDLGGLVYVPTKDEYGWKLRLVKELKSCGYNVAANQII